MSMEVERFRRWAATQPASARSGEWEEDYGEWTLLSKAVSEFLDDRPFAAWSAAETRDILYVLARNNEIQDIARRIGAEHPEALLPLTRLATDLGEPDARWQLAVELGRQGLNDETDAALLSLAQDDNHEYVRRRALQALATIGSPATELAALTAWDRVDPEQEHARMAALWALRAVGSPHFDRLLIEAGKDTGEYLAPFAASLTEG